MVAGGMVAVSCNMKKLVAPTELGTGLLRSGGPWTPLGRVRFAGVSLEETGVEEWPFRLYDAHALVLILAGEGSYRDAGGTTAPVRTGEAILVFPGLAHWYGPPRGTNWSELFVVFEGPVFDLWQRTGVLDSARPLLGLAEPGRVAQEIVDLLAGGRPATDADALTEMASFLGLLTRVVVSGAGEPACVDPLQRAQALLQSELGQRLEMAEVARRVEVPYETFRRRFRAVTGETPKRFRDAARIAAAKDLLRTSSMSNRELAAALGYADGFHFSRRFKQAVGVSPRTYRLVSASRLSE
jgi:AraC-like DNA-binding protein